jgi:hypothetical protein
MNVRKIFNQIHCQILIDNNDKIYLNINLNIQNIFNISMKYI